MAAYDQGGGCPCGVEKVCDCGKYDSSNKVIPQQKTHYAVDRGMMEVFSSLYEAVREAGGHKGLAGDFFFNEKTIHDLFDIMSKNNIRFVYKK